MKEKSLNHVGKDASERYANYKLQADRLSLAEKWASKFTEEETMGIVNSPDKVVNHHRRDLEQAVAEDRTFVEENATALHDLAVMLAHLDGKTIFVEEPLNVGREAEGVPNNLR